MVPPKMFKFRSDQVDVRSSEMVWHSCERTLSPIAGGACAEECLHFAKRRMNYYNLLGRSNLAISIKL